MTEKPVDQFGRNDRGRVSVLISVVIIIALATNFDPWMNRSPEVVVVSGSHFQKSIVRHGTILLAVAIAVWPGRSANNTFRLLIPKSILVFFIWAGISSLWSPVPVTTLSRCVMSLLIAAIVFGLVGKTSPRSSVEDFLKASIVAGMLSFLTVLINPELGIHQPYEESSIVGTWRGIYYTKNNLGPACAVFAIVSLYVFLKPRSRQQGVLAFLAILLNIVLLMGANSRNSIASLLIASAFLVLLHGVGSRVQAVRAISVFALIIGVTTMLEFAVVFLFGVRIEEGSFTGRGALWMILYSFIESSPIFGVGYGAIFQAGEYSVINSVSAEAWVYGITQGHSAYLTTMASVGAVGVIILLIVVFSGLSSALKMRSGSNASLFPLVVGLMVFALSHGLLEDGLGDGARFSWVAFMWSFGLARAKTVERSDA